MKTHITPEQSALLERLSALRLHGAVVTGTTALTIAGMDLPYGWAPRGLHFATTAGGNWPQHRDVTCRRLTALPKHRMFYGIPVAYPTHAYVDVAAQGPPAEWYVALAENLAQHDQQRLARLRDVAHATSRHGAAFARRAIAALTRFRSRRRKPAAGCASSTPASQHPRCRCTPSRSKHVRATRPWLARLRHLPRVRR